MDQNRAFVSIDCRSPAPFPDAKSQGCALNKQTSPAPGRRSAPVGCALTLGAGHPAGPARGGVLTLASPLPSLIHENVLYIFLGISEVTGGLQNSA